MQLVGIYLSSFLRNKKMTTQIALISAVAALFFARLDMAEGCASNARKYIHTYVDM